jgi:hypothetical protein
MASRKIKGPSPVSDRVLGRLYRASPEGLAVLVKTVPPQTRAALAVYCLHREHLSSIGFPAKIGEHGGHHVAPMIGAAKTALMLLSC